MSHRLWQPKPPIWLLTPFIHRQFGSWHPLFTSDTLYSHPPIFKFSNSQFQVFILPLAGFQTPTTGHFWEAYWNSPISSYSSSDARRKSINPSYRFGYFKILLDHDGTSVRNEIGSVATMWRSHLCRGFVTSVFLLIELSSPKFAIKKLTLSSSIPSLINILQ